VSYPRDMHPPCNCFGEHHVIKTYPQSYGPTEIQLVRVSNGTTLQRTIPATYRMAKVRCGQCGIVGLQKFAYPNNPDDFHFPEEVPGA